MKTFVFASVLGLIICISCNNRSAPTFSPDLEAYCQTLSGEFAEVPDSTGKRLREAGNYIINRGKDGLDINISFVCEHNSRKSHMGHVWTQMAVQYYGMENISCYSGGTTPTYVNERIITALGNAGFRISERGIAGYGPKYHLDYGNEAQGIEIFSKRYDHQMNPDTNYLAITLCYNPEECCPITGGDLQLTIPYEDMQPFDSTPQEEEMYDKQCRQIARDMFYMIGYVNENTVSASR
jgi:arsenate reductase